MRPGVRRTVHAHRMLDAIGDLLAVRLHHELDDTTTSETVAELWQVAESLASIADAMEATATRPDRPTDRPTTTATTRRSHKLTARSHSRDRAHRKRRTAALSARKAAGRASTRRRQQRP